MNKQFVTYIDQHICENISLGKIADAFGYSKYHFSRIFKERMNISVMEYVQKRKLTLSIEDILQGKRLVDIAIEYGWQSHSSYTKAFKKEFGVSPSNVKNICMMISEFGGSIMDNRNLKLTNGTETKEALEAILIETMTANSITFDAAELNEYIKNADKAYANLKRYSGDEYVTHTLNVAIILAQAEADFTTIIAGLFCDIKKKNPDFDDCMIPAVSRDIINELTLNEKEDVSDEALLVATAERLHNMRTVEYMPEDNKVARVKETLNSFLPVARRLKNNRLLDEINDLCIENLAK